MVRGYGLGCQGPDRSQTQFRGQSECLLFKSMDYLVDNSKVVGKKVRVPRNNGVPRRVPRRLTDVSPVLPTGLKHITSLSPSSLSASETLAQTSQYEVCECPHWLLLTTSYVSTQAQQTMLDMSLVPRLLVSLPSDVYTCFFQATLVSPADINIG